VIPGTGVMCSPTEPTNRKTERNGEKVGKEQKRKVM
jgi:hypothetical protein